MSFAQGLSSGFAMGTQLGNTIQDRRYTRDLAALEEQYKAQQQALQAPTPGAGQAVQEGAVAPPGVGLAIPGGAPVAQGQQVFDAAQQQRVAPPVSAIDRLQAQRGLAAKYNRVDELRRLDGLIAQQEQFSAQQAENDRRFGLQEQQFIAQQEQQKTANKQWKDTFEQQGEVIAAQKKNMEDQRANDAARLAAEVDQNTYNRMMNELPIAARGAVSMGFANGQNFSDIVANIPEQYRNYENLWNDAAMKAYEEVTGVKTVDALRVANDIVGPLKDYLRKSEQGFASEDAKQEGLNKALGSIDPDLTDGITPIIQKLEDGTYQVYYDNAPMENLVGESPEAIIGSFVQSTTGNMFNAVSLYDRQKQALQAKLQSAKTAEDRRAAMIEIAKTNPRILNDIQFAEAALQSLGFDTGLDPAGRFGGVATGQEAVKQLRSVLAGFDIGGDTGGDTGGLATQDIRSIADKKRTDAAQEKAAKAKTQQAFDREVLSYIRQLENGSFTVSEAREALRSGDLGDEAKKAVERALRAFNDRPLQDTKYFTPAYREALLGNQ